MKIGIIGATGYTGAELLRLLSAHPANIEVTVVTSRQDAGKPLTSLFPEFSGLANYDQLMFCDPQETGLKQMADLFFLATPHGASMALVPSLLDAGAKIIDLSADFRINDQAVYEQWYQTHSASQFLPEAIYGLPEIYAQSIRCARLVANPGCYPTSVILALTPFLKASLLDEGHSIIANSVSGVTGAGRGATLGTSFCEIYENYKGYKVTGHRHTPEIEQELGKAYGRPLTVSFTPHLAPINRGILSTIYVRPKASMQIETLQDIYEKFYAGKKFVRIRPQGFDVQTAHVRGTNYCDISLHYDHRANLVKIISAIDNLCRGASGQAVANLNLMCGFAEDAGLAIGPLKP